MQYLCNVSYAYRVQRWINNWCFAENSYFALQVLHRLHVNIELILSGMISGKGHLCTHMEGYGVIPQKENRRNSRPKGH